MEKEKKTNYNRSIVVGLSLLGILVVTMLSIFLLSYLSDELEVVEKDLDIVKNISRGPALPYGVIEDITSVTSSSFLGSPSCLIKVNNTSKSLEGNICFKLEVGDMLTYREYNSTNYRPSVIVWSLNENEN